MCVRLPAARLSDGLLVILRLAPIDHTCKCVVMVPTVREMEMESAVCGCVLCPKRAWPGGNVVFHGKWNESNGQQG